jgi:hypothetical protein
MILEGKYIILQKMDQFDHIWLDNDNEIPLKFYGNSFYLEIYLNQLYSIKIINNRLVYF